MLKGVGKDEIKGKTKAMETDKVNKVVKKKTALVLQQPPLSALLSRNKWYGVVLYREPRAHIFFCCISEYTVNTWHILMETHQMCNPLQTFDFCISRCSALDQTGRFLCELLPVFVLLDWHHLCLECGGPGFILMLFEVTQVERRRHRAPMSASLH